MLCKIPAILPANRYRLFHSKIVFAFVAGRPNDVPQLILTTPITLKTLPIIFSVVNKALAAHNRNKPSTVNNIILPFGGMRAYQELLLWVHDVVRVGKLVSLRDLTDKPLTCYSGLVFIANRLRISYLAAGLRRRVRGLFQSSRPKQLDIHPSDLRYAAANLPQGH